MHQSQVVLNIWEMGSCHIPTFLHSDFPYWGSMDLTLVTVPAEYTQVIPEISYGILNTTWNF